MNSSVLAVCFLSILTMSLSSPAQENKKAESKTKTQVPNPGSDALTPEDMTGKFLQDNIKMGCTFKNVIVKGTATGAFPGDFEERIQTFIPIGPEAQRKFVADFTIVGSSASVTGHQEALIPVGCWFGFTTGVAVTDTTFESTYTATIKRPHKRDCEVSGKATTTVKMRTRGPHLDDSKYIQSILNSTPCKK
jgi:hypothetical protein